MRSLMAPGSSYSTRCPPLGTTSSRAFGSASAYCLATSTGTIALRAIFKNEDTTLFPGLFARVRIPLGGPRPMLVIPGSAIGNDQQGDFVYVVGSGDVVERRSIVRGALAPGGIAIREGLTAGDRVIVNGLLNARAGEKVAPISQGAPGPAAEAPPRAGSKP